MELANFLAQKERKVLLANKVSVGNTILRNINMNQGIAAFDVKVCKISEIAEELVCAYDSFENQRVREVISRNIALKYLERTILSETYQNFPRKLISEETLKDLLNCMDELRLHEKTAEWDSAQDSKIKELKQMLETYEKLLVKDGLLDSAMVIQEAFRIVKANKEQLRMLLPWLTKSVFGNLETNLWSELEWAFICELNNKECENVEFLNDDVQRKNITYKFYKAYGIVNEIKHVLNQMKNPGETAIYYTTPVYINYIKAALDNKRVSYCITGGVPATQTNFMQFILGLLRVAQNDFLYADLKGVIQNRITTFYNVANDEVMLNPIKGYNDSLNYGIGWGVERYRLFVQKTRMECEELEKRQDIEDYVRKAIPGRRVYADFLENFISIFYEVDTEHSLYRERGIVAIAESAIQFAKDYTYQVNPEKAKVLDPLKVMVKELGFVDDHHMTVKQKAEYIERLLTDMNMEDSADGVAVLVAPLNGFTAIDRPDVYVVGLSATSFAVDTKQSPVLLDEEKYKYFKILQANENAGVIDLSIKRNSTRKNNVENSLRTMDHGQVSFSYSYYDTISLRESSPSVFFLDLSDKQEIEKVEGYVSENYLQDHLDDIKETVYIDQKALQEALVQMEQMRKPEAVEDEQGEKSDSVLVEERKEIEKEKLVEKKPEQNVPNMSASGLQELLKCPIAYHYKYVKYLRKYDELENNGYEWLNVTSKGNLCHRVMERYMAEVMPPKRSLSLEMDEDTFQNIYQKEIDKLKEELPYPSEAIWQKEESYYRQLIHTYIQRVHKQWNDDAKEGKNWNVIGCELAFSKLLYTDDRKPENTYQMNLNGSIDRLDGYVDENGVLRLRIVDYKTGKKESKQREVAEGIQIQHFIYAIAALSYIQNFLKSSDDTFNGKKVSKIYFEQIAYTFPYEKANGTEDYDVYDVTDEVFAEDDEALKWAIDLPDRVKDILQRTLGALQQGREGEYVFACDQLVQAAIEEKSKALQEKEYQKQLEKYEKEKKKKPDLEAPKKEEIEVEYSQADFCKGNYCKYKDICRKWVGEK